MKGQFTSLTSQEIGERLREHHDVLKKYTVRRIGLFGSFARGEQRQESDIDFLVSFEEPTFDHFMELVFYLEQLFGREVELITDGSLSPYLKPYIEKEVQWYEV